MCCHLYSFIVMRAFHSKSISSVHKTKIPVNKLTFGEGLATFSKSQSAPFLSAPCGVQPVSLLHVIDTECCNALFFVFSHRWKQTAVTISELFFFSFFFLYLKAPQPFSAKTALMHTLIWGQLWCLTWSFQPLLRADFLTASECVNVSFCVWADVSVHDVAVMLVKLLWNYITQRSSDSPSKSTSLWRMSTVMHVYTNLI